MERQILLKQLYSIISLKEDIFVAGVFVFALYMGAFFIRKRNGDAVGAKELTLGILLSAATGLILGMTLFSREYNPLGRNFELNLFWSYKKAFGEADMGLGVEIFCNILLFMPWGYLMPAVWKRFEDFRWLLSAALLLSGTVELIQGIFRLGLFEFDDILNNTIGALIGWGFYRIIKN